MDIPKFKDANTGVPIDVKTSKGIVKLYASSLTRGVGPHKWRLTIEGFCREAVAEMEEGHVFFGGGKPVGKFSKVKEKNGLWLMTFEVVITEPVFWGD